MNKTRQQAIKKIEKSRDKMIQACSDFVTTIHQEYHAMTGDSMFTAVQSVFTVKGSAIERVIEDEPVVIGIRDPVSLKVGCFTCHETPYCQVKAYYDPSDTITGYKPLVTKRLVNEYLGSEAYGDMCETITITGTESAGWAALYEPDDLDKRSKAYDATYFGDLELYPLYPDERWYLREGDKVCRDHTGVEIVASTNGITEVIE